MKSEIPSPSPAVAPFDAQKAKEHQENWAKHLGVPVDLTNSIGMKLVLIPPGEFTMGSPKELIEEELKTPGIEGWYKECLASEGPQHRVRITKPFYLGTYLVTQEEYQRVVGTNPSAFSATGDCKGRVAGQDTKRFPVENVSWDDAVGFCRKLSDLPEEGAMGRAYRLPSEAQWEYACRAGSTGRFSFSLGGSGISKESEEQKLSGYGWINGNSGGMPHAVGGKQASPWGLFDMYGNMNQWCQDWLDKDYYAKSATDDPTGPPGGSAHVVRGGTCSEQPRGCRSACRHLPGDYGSSLGFRVSLVLADTAKKPSADLKSQISNFPESRIPSPESPTPPPVVAPVPAPERPKPPAKKEAKPEIATAPATPGKPQRLPPPSAAVQQEISSQVEDAYKLADARKPEEQIKLAKKTR